MSDLPRIASVTVTGPTMLAVEWNSGASDRIDLAGWIATGGELLQPLSDSSLFSAAASGENKTMVVWGDEHGDLAIDAVHLRMLADEQRPFRAAELSLWQEEMKLSNQEAKDFLGVSLSTFNAWKSGANIPSAIGLACRAARRDPLLMQAHYRPRRPGRPRKALARSAAV